MFGNKGNLVKTINDEINAQTSVLTDPTGISTLEEYKYCVGVIKGLETALEIFNEILIDGERND
jgi:hypothetical protein